MKEGNPVTDWPFVRRTIGEQLRRTLVKYSLFVSGLLERRKVNGGAQVRSPRWGP